MARLAALCPIQIAFHLQPLELSLYPQENISAMLACKAQSDSSLAPAQKRYDLLI